MDSGPKRKFSSYTPTELRSLCEEDPDSFAELANVAIKDACVGTTPAGTVRLRQMQWSIDAQLLKGKTPLERMQIMEKIFYGQVYGSNGELAKLLSTSIRLLGAISGSQVRSSKRDGRSKLI